MKVALKPEYQIVESCSLIQVLPVGNDGKEIGGWLALYAPSLGKGSGRPYETVAISESGKVRSGYQKCRGEDWQVVAHRMFIARSWPSPWQVVR